METRHTRSTHRRSSLHRPRPNSPPQTVLSCRTTNCPFPDETSVAVEGSDKGVPEDNERRARRQRWKIPHGELRRAGLCLPTQTRLTSMKKEERRPFPMESSGQLGCAVSSRTYRRGSPLRRTCPNKSSPHGRISAKPVSPLLRTDIEELRLFIASAHRRGTQNP